MSASVSRHLVPVLLLLWTVAPARALESDHTARESPSTLSAGDDVSGMSAAREAALRTTLEKRRAKRARARAAYQRSTASANAIMLSSLRPAPRPPGMFSRAPGYASGAAGLEPITANNGGYRAAFSQAAGGLGTTGMVSAGGTGGCQRP